MQYLVQWANGTFQVLTAEQLRKELDTWQKAPPRMYRLVPNRDPERLWCIRVKNTWMLGDIYRNMIEI